MQVPRPTRRRKGPTSSAATTPAEAASKGAVIAGPGSKRRRGEVPLDDIRKMVLERITERGLTIADISRALNKNEAYLHQFIWRRSPKWLREADRAVVCRLLEIPEAVLMPPMPDTVPSSRGLLLSPSIANVSGQRDIPLFREDDEINAAAPSDWVYRLPGLVAGALYALWITAEHGRFSPGDTIYVHQRQPPRVGDHVVVTVDQHIVGIGKLVGWEADGTPAVEGLAKRRLPVSMAGNCQRIVAALYG